MMQALQDWFELFIAQFPFVATSYAGGLVAFGVLIIMVASLAVIGILGVLVLTLGPFATLTGVIDIRRGWPRFSVAVVLVLGFTATLGAVLMALWLTFTHGSYLHSQSIAWWNLAGLLAGLSAILVLVEMYLRKRFPAERDIESIDIFELFKEDESPKDESSGATSATRTLPTV